MEICMTAEEFTRSAISNYNRLRQETKEYMICEINDALRSAYNTKQKMMIRLSCPQVFKSAIEDVKKWESIVEEIQKELVNNGFRTTWILISPKQGYKGILTVEVSNNE
jgi:hypothetical protein